MIKSWNITLCALSQLNYSQRQLWSGWKHLYSHVNIKGSYHMPQYKMMMIKTSYAKLLSEATMIRLMKVPFTYIASYDKIIIYQTLCRGNYDQVENNHIHMSSSNHHIIKSSNHQITKSSNDQITKSSNDQMIKSWSNQTMIRELNLAGNQLRTLDKEVTKPLSLIVFKFQVLSF